MITGKHFTMSAKKKLFSDLVLSYNVQLGLENSFIKVSPFHRRAILLGCSSFDLLIQSKTCNGKTAALAIIILEAFQPDVREPQSLLIIPNREIALNMQTNLIAIGSHTPGFSVGCFIGKLDIANDRENIKDCRSIVGTPDRILHLITSKILNTDEIGIVVLDESDQLIRSPFLEDIQSVLCHINPKRQVIAASKTFKNGIDIQLAQLMRNPISVTHKLSVPMVLGIKQFGYSVESFNTSEMFAKFNAIQHVLSVVQFEQCIIFTNEQSNADSCCKFLSENGWLANVISYCLNENVCLKQIITFQCRILVTTDVMACHIHSEDVNLVINLDMPADIRLYLHRIAVGRISAQAMVVTLLAGDLELSQFQLLLGSLGEVPMVAEKFPHIQEIDIWTYHSVDVRDKIFGTECVLQMKKETVQTLVCKQTPDDQEWFETTAAKSIEPFQSKNEYSGDGERQKMDDIEDVTLLIDFEDKPTKNTEENLPELQLGNPFKEYDTLLTIGIEVIPKPKEKTVSVPLNFFQTKNIQQASDTELNSISGNDPFESILQCEIPQKLPSPLIAVTKSEIQAKFDIGSVSGMKNVAEETLEFNVSLHDQLFDTLKFNAEIGDDCNWQFDMAEHLNLPKPYNIDSTVIAIDLSNDKINQSEADVYHLKSSKCMTPTGDLINLFVSLEPPTKLPDIKFLNEDPFEYLSKSILIDEQTEPAEIVMPTKSNDALPDAIAEIEFYLNTKNKKTQSATDLDLLTFDWPVAKITNNNGISDTNSELFFNTVSSNALNKISKTDYSIQADEGNALSLSSGAGYVDQKHKLAEDNDTALSSDDRIVEEVKDTATSRDI